MEALLELLGAIGEIVTAASLTKTKTGTQYVFVGCLTLLFVLVVCIGLLFWLALL